MRNLCHPIWLEYHESISGRIFFLGMFYQFIFIPFVPLANSNFRQNCLYSYVWNTYMKYVCGVP